MTPSGVGPLAAVTLESRSSSPGTAVFLSGFDMEITGDLTNNAGGSSNTGFLMENAFLGTSGSLTVGGNILNDGFFTGASGETLTVTGIMRATTSTYDLNGATVDVGLIDNQGGVIRFDGGTVTAGGIGNANSGGITGTIELGGGSLTYGSADVFTNTGLFEAGLGGTITANDDLENNVGGEFNLETSDLFMEGSTLTNNGIWRNSFNSSDSSSVVFRNTGIGTEQINGSFVSTDRIYQLEIESTATVTLGNDIEVFGSLVVREDGQLGAGDRSTGTINENNVVTFAGSDFLVEFTNDSQKGYFFASEVIFNNNNSTSTNPVNAAGELFAATRITNTAFVELTQPLIINDVLTVESQELALATGGSLTLRDDFNVGVGATFDPGGRTVTFDGMTNTGGDPSSTSCTGVETADGDCEQDITAGGTISLGPVEVDGTNTRVVLSGFASNSTIPSITNLTVDPGADDTNTQLALNDSDLEISGNVTNDGNLVVGDKELRFVSGSSQFIDSPNQDLSLADMFVANTSTSGLTINPSTNIAVSDTLEISEGKITLGDPSVFSVDGALALFGSEEVSGAFRNGVAIDATAAGARFVLTSSGTTEGYVLYRDSDSNGTIDGRVDGNVVKQRFMNDGEGWYFVAAPRESATNDTFSQFFRQGLNTNSLHLQGFPGADKDPTNSEGAANVYSYDEGVGGDEDLGFEVIGDAANSLQSGLGYIIYVFLDDDFDTAGTQGGFPKLLDSEVEMYSSVSSTFPIQGSDPDGDGFDSFDGWNLLGNPYLATLDWEAIWNQASTTDVESTIYIWDDINNQYQTWNAATQSGSLGAPDLDPHQAFFVKASSTVPSLSIDDVEDVQLDRAGAYVGKSSSEPDPLFAFQVDWNSRSNQAFVALNEGSSFDKDFADSFQLDPIRSDGGAVTLYSILDDGTHLETNALPGEITEEISIPLNVDAYGCSGSTAISSEAVLTWPEFRSVPTSVELSIEDTQTGEVYDLRQSSEIRFSLTSGSSCGSKSTAQVVDASSVLRLSQDKAKSIGGGRFLLTIIPNNALPVEMGSFTGSADGDRSAVLEWTTLSESNNSGFYVEQKVDGSFQTVSSLIEGAGTTTEQQSYRFRIDDLEVGTTHSFRLRQVDVDGDKSYSDPVDIKLGIQEAYKLEAYPNPVQSGEQAKVRFAVDERQPVTIELYNTLGQRVQTLYSGAPRVIGEFQEVTVNASDLASGVYFVRMRGESFATTQKLVVVR